MTSRPSIGRYVLHEALGSGAMGSVFRARDTHLERDVAIKLLAEGRACDDAMRRQFRQEALALSQLNHPAVATVFDFDTRDGVDYLVMECIGGPSLEDVVRQGPLPEGRLLAMARALAEGLAAAHAQGVLHRDLKPANLRFTEDGRIKIVDFGLAQTIEAPPDLSGAAAEDRRGVSGTLPYLAPEILRGEIADVRTDLYALGAVLYEAATGKRAFLHDTMVSLVYAILHEPPAPPRTLNPRLSPALERLLLTALAKDPAYRHRTAQELADDVARVQALPVTPASARNPRIESLVVLPLVNLSPDAEQEYFADAMTDALITNLAQIGSLRVISRASAMHYKHSPEPLSHIARRLGVDAVVTGSARRWDDRARITTHLVHAATEHTLWAQDFESDVAHVFDLQRDVAQGIAQQVRTLLTPQEQARFGTVRAVDPAAYDAYLRGRFYANRLTSLGFQRAKDAFRRAIAADPAFAPAYSGLSYVEFFQRQRSAKAAARRAIELDDTLAEAHVNLANIVLHDDYAWARCEAEFGRALELDPALPEAHHHYAAYLWARGRFPEAMRAIRRAQDLDPLSLFINSAVGETLYYGGDYPGAITQLRATVELEENFWHSHFFLGRALQEMGDHAQAIAELRTSLSLPSGVTERLGALGHALAVAGQTDEALLILRTLETAAADGQDVTYGIATVHTALGELDKAMTWLHRAREQRPMFVVWVKVDPRLRPLHGHPGFAELLGAMGLGAA